MTKFFYTTYKYTQKGQRIVTSSCYFCSTSANYPAQARAERQTFPHTVSIMGMTNLAEWSEKSYVI